MAETVALTPRDDGVQLKLRAKPGARADRLLGPHGGALKLEVRAAPERGKANVAITKLLAEVFGVARAQVAITGGAGSQNKTVMLYGLSGAEATRALAEQGVAAELKT